MFLLRDEGRVRRVIRREEKRALREDLEAVHVPECAAESQRREGREDESPETPFRHRRRDSISEEHRQPDVHVRALGLVAVEALHDGNLDADSAEETSPEIDDHARSEIDEVSARVRVAVAVGVDPVLLGMAIQNEALRIFRFNLPARRAIRGPSP
jgi:hypothetical protein